MQVRIESRTPRDASADLLTLALPQLDPKKWRPSARVKAVDNALDGSIGRVLSAGDFRGKAGETLMLYPNGGSTARRVLLLGLGPEASVDAEGLRRAAGTAIAEAIRRKAKIVAFALPSLRRIRGAAATQALAEGAVLAGYRFDRYQEPSRQKERSDVTRFSVLIERAADLRPARTGARTGVALGESQNVARDLSNQPANALPPVQLAREAEKMAKETGLRCRVMEVPELKRRKMGALLAVGQGSTNPPRLVVLEHNAPGGRRGKKRSGRRQPTVCLVGKGITFDSGGISIKPSAGMDEMKHDMSGAATVVGAMRAVAILDVPLHVVGILAAAENMPSGTAYRPGDVVKAMSGKTIEVLNTDAEGRVVLADALHYAREEFDPVAMVDLATLTGACVIALGKAATGLFGNNERLVEHVRRSGETSGERAWPMPLWDDHRKMVRSEIADVKNTAGREAGSSTAAAFLDAFVGDTPWVHLDIAGTGWTSKTNPCQPRGATGVGVRLLLEMLRTWNARAV